MSVFSLVLFVIPHLLPDLTCPLFFQVEVPPNPFFLYFLASLHNSRCLWGIRFSFIFPFYLSKPFYTFYNFPPATLLCLGLNGGQIVGGLGEWCKMDISKSRLKSEVFSNHIPTHHCVRLRSLPESIQGKENVQRATGGWRPKRSSIIRCRKGSDSRDEEGW